MKAKLNAATTIGMAADACRGRRRWRRSLAGLALRLLAGGRCSASGRGTSAGRSATCGSSSARTGPRRTAARAALRGRCACGGRNAGRRGLASSSRWKIIWPQVGHLCHRLSGVLASCAMSACSFGRTKLVSQFMPLRSSGLRGVPRTPRPRLRTKSRSSFACDGAGLRLPTSSAGQRRADQRRADHGGVGDRARSRRPAPAS